MRTVANSNMLFSCTLLFVITGCADLKPASNSSAVSNQVEIVHDDFKNITFYRGPLISNSVENTGNAPEVEELSLHARKAQDEAARYYLSITDYYAGDWRGFDQAFDAGGSKFHAIAVRHKVNCILFCDYDEELDIEITRDYLAEHAQTGITMRLYGPSDVASAPFTLSAAYIEGFLNSLNGY